MGAINSRLLLVYHVCLARNLVDQDGTVGLANGFDMSMVRATAAPKNAEVGELLLEFVETLA